MGEACPHVKNTYIPSMQRRKQSKLDTAGNVQAVKGVFMVGSAARIVTKT